MKFDVGDQVRIITKGDLFYKVGEISNAKETGQHPYNVLWGNGNYVWVREDEIELVKKGGDKMTDKEEGRGLFGVIVVNPTEDGEIILDEKVVARDNDEAKMVSNIKDKLKEKKLRLGDVDIIVTRIGNVRDYETEQKVKIVGSIDGFSLVKKEK